MPDNDVCGVFRIVAQVITWVLIIGGWWVINRQNNWRESRKETRAALNQLLDELNQIELQAYQYHQASPPSLVMGRDLKLALSRVSNFIDRQNLLPRGKRQPLAKLRRAITLNNFDTEHFMTQEDDSELLAGVSAAKDQLVDALERQFLREYRASN